MTTTNFVNGTPIVADWMNDVDQAIYQANTNIPGSTPRTLVDKISENISVKDFGAVGDGVTDDTDAIQAAINTNKTVLIPYTGNPYCVSHLEISQDHQIIIAEGYAYFKSVGTPDASSVIEVSGDFCKLINVYILTDNILSDGILVSGFRDILDNCTVTGGGSVYTCLSCVEVQGKETTILQGKYKNGSVAGVNVNDADLYIQNAYLEKNKRGLRSSSTGAITAHHVHAYDNEYNGFWLYGAAACQLTSCYADTNGQHGFEIGNLDTGTVLLNCWSYKSSNQVAGYSDFRIINALNVRMIGCRSNGAGAYAKAYSYNIDSASRATLIGCYAEDAVNGFISGITSVIACDGTLMKYNRSTDIAQGESASLGAAASSTYTLATDFYGEGSFSSPGLLSFEVTILYRNTGGTSCGVEKKIVSIGLGTTVDSIQDTVPYTGSEIAISSPQIVERAAADGIYELSFTVTNNKAYAIQYACNVRFLGSGRGFI